MHSAYWFWPQYRRRYGHDEKGFLQYTRQMLPAFRRCLHDFATLSDASAASAAGGGKERIDRGALELCAFNFESLSAVRRFPRGLYLLRFP